MITKIENSTIDARQEWATPADFWAAVLGLFAPTMDVCARMENAKCPAYITPEMDALSPRTKWLPEGHAVAWCNPGFSKPLPWLQKAALTVEHANDPEAVVLVLGLVSPSTEWWRYAERKATIWLIGGSRIQFDPATGVERSSNARENALFIFRPEKSLIRKVSTWYWKDAAC